MKSLQRALLCGASAIAVYSAVPVGAFAQTDENGVETVIVTGIRESLRDSLVMKQNAALITENISTKDIGQLPDITIGEELNRLPGVNTQRDRGNASQIAIRGLGPRFVFGLVNGREVASSEPSQNVRYESYPSEILAGAQVYKTQDAGLIPGGIAATIDIRTTAPLEYEGPTIQLRAGPSYNTEANKLPNYDGLGYRGSAAYITHLTDNFAIAIAASIQREKNGYPNLSFWTENTNQPDTGWGDPANLDGHHPTVVLPGSIGLTGGNPAPWGGQTEIKELQQDRYGLAGAAEWRVNSNLVIKADGLWSSYVISENQLQQWYDTTGNVWPAGNWTSCGQGSVTSGTITPAMLVACTNATNRFGDSGIPGLNPTGGGAAVYANGLSSFKLDSMGHVVRANLVSPSNNVNFQNNFARYWQRQTLVVEGLNFDWTHGEWSAKLDLSHSEAWRNNQWLDFQTNGQWEKTTGYNMEKGTKPYVTAGFDPAVPAANLTTYTAGSTASGGTTWCNRCLDAGPEMTRDHISAAALDLARAIDDSFFKSFDFGGRYSERQKSHHQFDYTILYPGGATSFFPYGTPSGTLPVGDLKEFTLTGFASVPNMLYVNWDKAVPIVFGNIKNTLPASLGGTAGNPYLQVASWNLRRQGANAAHGFANQIQNWQVQETTYEGYAKVEFAHDFGGIPMAGALGVRVDNIRTVSTGVQTTDGATFTPVSVSNQYTDVLPSLNLNFHVADDKVVRFGAAMAQSRPPLDTLNTGYSLNTSTTGVPASNVGGNPKLKPFKASQVDLSYEWYFHPESLFSVAAYYKHIMNYIGSGISQQIIGGTSYAITSPMNGPGGNLEGVEFSFQSRLYFLPGALSDFGIYANASFVTSDIKEFHPMLNPYSMGGLAKNSDEFDLFYDRGGFEARIATKYHSSFTMIPGWASGQLDTLDPEVTVDATVSYQWNDNLGFRLQGLNLTNQVTRFSGGRQAGDALRGSNDPNDLAAYSVFGRTFMFDVSYKD